MVVKAAERGHHGSHSFGNKDNTRFEPVETVVLSGYPEISVESRSGTQKSTSLVTKL